MSIETNVAATKAAKTIVDLAVETAAELPADVRPRFWGTVDDLVAALVAVTKTPTLTAPAAPPAMTDAEAKGFGQITVPERFKKHAGQCVDDVPLEYWFYLLEPDVFLDDVARYVRSDRIQAEQGATE